jgi:hypothetical protein
MQDNYAYIQSCLDYEREGNKFDFDWDWDRISNEIESIWNSREQYRDEIVSWLQSLTTGAIEKLRAKFGQDFPEFFEWIDSIFPTQNTREIYLLSPGL